MKNLIFLLVLFLVGCHGFKNPPFKKSDLKEIPGIEGSWDMYLVPEGSSKRGDSNKWAIKKTNKNEYIFQNTEDPNLTLYGSFFEVAHQDFISLEYPGTPQRPIPRGKLHFVVKIQYADSLIRGIPIDIEHLISLSNSGVYPTKFETFNDPSSEYSTGSTYLVTEPTRKVRKLLKNFKDDPEMFPSKVTFLMVRRKK